MMQETLSLSLSLSLDLVLLCYIGGVLLGGLGGKGKLRSPPLGIVSRAPGAETGGALSRPSKALEPPRLGHRWFHGGGGARGMRSQVVWDSTNVTMRTTTPRWLSHLSLCETYT
jgi:hypothetical protein